jgi:hypothetical protein
MEEIYDNEFNEASPVIRKVVRDLNLLSAEQLEKKWQSDKDANKVTEIILTHCLLIKFMQRSFGFILLNTCLKVNDLFLSNPWPDDAEPDLKELVTLSSGQIVWGMMRANGNFVNAPCAG